MDNVKQQNFTPFFLATQSFSILWHIQKWLKLIWPLFIQELPVGSYSSVIISWTFVFKEQLRWLQNGFCDRTTLTFRLSDWSWYKTNQRHFVKHFQKVLIITDNILITIWFCTIPQHVLQLLKLAMIFTQ